MCIRDRPLDAKCRELNEKYLLPIGYELNNMFLVDWNEDDFGELNFYDMFDLLDVYKRQMEISRTNY